MYLVAVLSADDVERTHSQRLDAQHTELAHTKGAEQRPEIGYVDLIRRGTKERCRKKLTEDGKKGRKNKGE